MTYNFWCDTHQPKSIKHCPCLNIYDTTFISDFYSMLHLQVCCDWVRLTILDYHPVSKYNRFSKTIDSVFVFILQDTTHVNWFQLKFKGILSLYKLTPIFKFKTKMYIYTYCILYKHQKCLLTGAVNHYVKNIAHKLCMYTENCSYT